MTFLCTISSSSYSSLVKHTNAESMMPLDGLAVGCIQGQWRIAPEKLWRMIEQRYIGVERNWLQSVLVPYLFDRQWRVNAAVRKPDSNYVLLRPSSSSVMPPKGEEMTDSEIQILLVEDDENDIELTLHALRSENLGNNIRVA